MKSAWYWLLVAVLVGGVGVMSWGCRPAEEEEAVEVTVDDTDALELDIRPVPRAQSADNYILDAVRSGAAFLAESQNEDGGWGAPGHSEVGTTGLIVRALATTPVESGVREEYAEVIDRGVEYLLSKRRLADGAISNDHLLLNYRTSIAARALIAVDPVKYEDEITQAVKYTLGIQGANPDDPATYGAMGYGSDHTKGDIINTGEAMQLLFESGLSEDHEAWDRVQVFLARVQNLDEGQPDEGVKTANDGGAIYRSVRDVEGASKVDEPLVLPDGTEVPRSYGGATYQLLRGLIFSGLERDNPRVQAAFNWIGDHYTVTEHPELGQQGLYYFYYTMARTLETWGSAVIAARGEEVNWARDLSDEVALQQEPDGSWVNPEPRWWEDNKPLSTAYSVLTLNICARMLEEE